MDALLILICPENGKIEKKVIFPQNGALTMYQVMESTQRMCVKYPKYVRKQTYEHMIALEIDFQVYLDRLP